MRGVSRPRWTVYGFCEPGEMRGAATLVLPGSTSRERSSPPVTPVTRRHSDRVKPRAVGRRSTHSHRRQRFRACSSARRQSDVRPRRRRPRRWAGARACRQRGLRTDASMRFSSYFRMKPQKPTRRYRRVGRLRLPSSGALQSPLWRSLPSYDRERSLVLAPCKLLLRR